ncbi:hypothetical protein Psi01_30470 [Planobispora siamensis]|uniref:Uncharacterized protein n=1 Tax=Planobispora siamensis TaxID=936338 RepID=A0A8J3WLC2_9ACTN|nr:hypothetical protein Psi01_30470 [Planobispora siamensis]
MVLTALASDSTSSAWDAPRDSASSPTAPDPAYRSSTRAPSSEPSSDPTVEKIASLARSLVGRVRFPGGTASRLPPAIPAMTRLTPPFSRVAAETHHRSSEGVWEVI